MNLPDIRKRLSEIDGVLTELATAQQDLSSKLADNVGQRNALREERAGLEATILVDVVAAMGDAPDAACFADMGAAVDKRLGERKECEPAPPPVLGR